MFILNDLHIGASRKAGTTPTSASALKNYLQHEFARLVHQCHGHLCILGDLFDSFSVDVGEVVKVYETLCDYINDGGTLTLVCGNHDHSPRPGTSSFHLLAHILKSRFPNEVKVVDYTNGLTEIEDKVWAISHVANQDLFDLEIEKVLQVSGTHLLLHCNVESPWESADHSLNVTTEQIDKLTAAGWKLIVAHEHAGRVLHHGKVHIIGNQVASSVSDCLNDLNEHKVYLELKDATVTEHVSCKVSDLYRKIDWFNLDDVDPNLKFIRVGGAATVAEAPAALAAIAKLRQSHDAFVITNAVEIEGMSNDMEVASLESVKSFNVLEALMEVLSPEEGKVVKELLEC